MSSPDESTAAKTAGAPPGYPTPWYPARSAALPNLLCHPLGPLHFLQLAVAPCDLDRPHLAAVEIIRDQLVLGLFLVVLQTHAKLGSRDRPRVRMRGLAGVRPGNTCLKTGPGCCGGPVPGSDSLRCHASIPCCEAVLQYPYHSPIAPMNRQLADRNPDNLRSC